MKILVIQQKMIGDVLLSTLICKNLKIWNPTIKIDFVANNHTLGVLENNPYIDNIIVFQDTFKNDKLGLIKFINLRLLFTAKSRFFLHQRNSL